MFTTAYQENMVTSWGVIWIVLRSPCSMGPALPLCCKWAECTAACREIQVHRCGIYQFDGRWSEEA